MPLLFVSASAHLSSIAFSAIRGGRTPKRFAIIGTSRTRLRNNIARATGSVRLLMSRSIARHTVPQQFRPRLAVGRILVVLCTIAVIGWFGSTAQAQSEQGIVAQLPGASPFNSTLTEALETAWAERQPDYRPRTRHFNTPTGSTLKRAPTYSSTRITR